MKATGFCLAVAPVSTVCASSLQTALLFISFYFIFFKSNRTPGLQNSSLMAGGGEGRRGKRGRGRDALWQSPGTIGAGLLQAAPRELLWEGAAAYLRLLFICSPPGWGKLHAHIGQRSVGQQIKPAYWLFELSSRKKDCSGTEPK